VVQAVAGRPWETVVALAAVANEDHHRATAAALATVVVHRDGPAAHARQPGRQETIEVERPNARF
jgi:hypothetical protein